MKKNNYKVQNGCHNCKHKFIKYEWDEEREYYCGLGASKRPACGSVAMNECYRCGNGEVNPMSDEKEHDKFVSKSDKAWNIWSKNRLVVPYGICKKHELVEKKDGDD